MSRSNPSRHRTASRSSTPLSKPKPATGVPFGWSVEKSKHRISRPTVTPSSSLTTAASRKFLPPEKSQPEPIDTGNLTHIDAHTGLSPDGLILAVTDHKQIYTLPATGGQVRLLTKQSPSHFAAWWPDGYTILFTGQREGRVVVL